MSYTNVGLSRLLKVFYADDRQRISLLRDDIRSEIRSQEIQNSTEARDFYIPFWADARRHISGQSDLSEATRSRISSHQGRARLYPLLERGFLV